MKKILLIVTVFSLFTPLFIVQAAESVSLAQKLSGKILLQVESYGRAWYVAPDSLRRYYLQNGDAAYQIMRTLSLGITNADLAKIPIVQGEMADSKLVRRLQGKILLQVEEHGEAWYLDPADGLRYYLKDGQAAYELMRQHSLGITTANLGKIPVNDEQVVPDTAFSDVAAVGYDGQNIFGGKNDQVILPLASLTKLMTALVFLDTNPDWQQVITITAEQINYPKNYVGDDNTSEVDLQAGDQVKVIDLWVAMLVASSNQAAAILAQSTGYAWPEYVSLMNRQAANLNLSKTKFFDVAGLDAHNVSTADEFVRLAHQAFAQEKILWGAQQNDYSFTVTDASSQSRTVKVINRNYSLLTFQPDATKTGFLVEAQRNVALLKKGRVIVVLHARSIVERNTLIESLLQK
ncbi:D-alanyl-D-alanine carboxypeptidase [Candidatus Falkowbacteria bacterium]|nr:D-alanyl-D-alanine carboxypeptidase [Candidatus Falkowbacteria bacterium]